MKLRFSCRFAAVALVVLSPTGLLVFRLAQAKPPAGGEELAQVTAAIETLADHPSGMVKLFAKRLVDVLAKDAYKDKVSLSAKLKALQVQPNQVNPEDKDLAAIHDAVAKIIEPARAGKGVPAAAGVELLEVIARHCPSSASSMEAASGLAAIAQSSLSGQAETTATPEAAAGAIREALYKCFDHTHCAWINDDDVQALKLAAGENLMQALAYLQACTGQKPDAEALKKALEEVNRRVNEGAAPRESENVPGADDVLKVILSQLEAVLKDSPAIAEMAAARKDIAGLLRQFLTAVNQEDRKTAAACVTPEMAKALEKLPGLRAAVGGGGEVEKIEFRHIAGFGAPGRKRFVDAQVVVTAKQAGAKARTARMSLQPTAEGWKIAAPS